MLSNYLKRFFRRRMKPVPIYKAVSTREKLSLVYMFVAWNLLAVTVYQYIYRDRSKDKDNSAKAWAQYLGIQNATIHSYDGLARKSTEHLGIDATPASTEA